MRRAMMVAALTAAVLVPACGGGEMLDGSTEGGGNDVIGGGDATDTGPSDGPRADVRDAGGDSGLGMLFRPCVDTAACGPGLTCNLGYPGGLCTVRCTADRNCGASGICAGMFGCLPACQAGNDDCQPYSGICFIFDAMDQSRRGCFPSCYETPPTGVRGCAAPRVCDPHAGVCTMPPIMPPGPGANGVACMSAMDCMGGRCFQEIDTMSMPTGWINGSCFSVGRTPANEDFMTGMPWPRSNCPMNSVAIPAGAMPAPGDPAICARECRMDSDCRAAEGYNCFRGRDPMTMMPAFTTGGCLPINCLDTVHTCPSGFRCMARTGTMMPSGFCVRTAGGDAGPTDSGATDSGATDSGTTDSGAAETGGGG